MEEFDLSSEKLIRKLKSIYVSKDVGVITDHFDDYESLRNISDLPPIIPPSLWPDICSILLEPNALSRIKANFLYKKYTGKQISAFVSFACGYSIFVLGHVICVLCREKEQLLINALFYEKKVLKNILNILNTFVSNFQEDKTPPSLQVVFNGFIRWKAYSKEMGLSSFYSDFFYHYAEKYLDLDYKTYLSFRESIDSNDYSLFRDLVFNTWKSKEIKDLSCEQKLIYSLFSLVELLYNVDLSSDHDTIMSRLHTNPAFSIENLLALSLLIKYFYDHAIVKLLDQDVKNATESYWKMAGLEKLSKIYKQWVNKEIQLLIHDSQSSDLDGNSISKDHLSVGHDVETIKKLAKYLVNGFSNSKGSLPALVSSNDGNAINKLVFLFTGNHDYSFDGPYNLKWEAEQVYLKLLIQLVHNLNELATDAHAIDKTKNDYISREYIKCNLKGGVWSKVANAFENVKGEGSIRNAKYANWKETENPTNVKRQKDMRLIAGLWLKCKDDIDC